MPTLSIAQVIRATGTPAFVKNASVADDADYDFSTRESTYISYVRALVKNASSDELNSCNDYARFWNIEKECLATKTKYAELVQPWDMGDEAFALVYTQNDKQVRKYAAYDSATTYKAAEAFYDNRTAYPFAMRNEAASKLLQKAATYKCPLPEFINTYLHKAAALGAAGVVELENALIQRDEACPQDCKEDMEKVASVFNTLIETESLRSNHEFLKEAMTAVDRFDSTIGGQVPLIEEIISSGLVVPELEKIAAEDKNIVKLANGREIDYRTVTKEVLAALDPNLVKMSAEELKDILPTLPKPDADLLVRILS